MLGCELLQLRICAGLQLPSHHQNQQSIESAQGESKIVSSSVSNITISIGGFEETVGNRP
jgi:hypothetical protein